MKAKAANREAGVNAEAARRGQLRHDLQNVVGNMAGFAEMLAEDAADPGLRAELQKIQQAALRMLEWAAGALDKGSRQGTNLLPLRQVREGAVEIGELIELRLGELGAGAADHAMAEDLRRIGTSARETCRLVDEAAAELSRTPVGGPSELPASASDAGLWIGVEQDGEISRPEAKAGLILVVDDLASNRELLTRRLARIGYATRTAGSGLRALEMVAEAPVDLILLDVVMPDMDGLEALRRLKGNPVTAGIPVVMLSASDQIDTVVQCIKLGAEDFLPKPFNEVLLLARIESSLSKKRLRDRETQFVERLQREQDRSERLLLNILPPMIADRLKQGEKNIADNFPEVTVLFSDFVGFTQLSSRVAPKDLVSQLNAVFSAFDHLCAEHGLEKIKTIGDSFMAVAGLPVPMAAHAEAAAELALAMQAALGGHAAPDGGRFRMRIGLNTGPVVAGVIGSRKFAYDVWGDTVNVASRMEQLAPPGGILVSRATRDRLKEDFVLRARGPVALKGKGSAPAYLLAGRR